MTQAARMALPDGSWKRIQSGVPMRLTMCNRALFAAVASLTCFCSTGAHGATTFFVNNLAGFNSANSGNTLVGAEDWENNNLAPATIGSAFSDPLLPGVANGPFTSGISTTLNMKVQANTGGASSATLAPRGAGALIASSDGAAGFSGNIAPSSQLSVNRISDSFDMIFDTPFLAVSLVPLYFSDTGQPSTATLSIKVYNTSNVLVGSTIVSNVADSLENSFVGVVASGGDMIGRINVSDASATNNYSGADSIRGFVVPEVSSSGILAGFAALMTFRRKRARI